MVNKFRWKNYEKNSMDLQGVKMPQFLSYNDREFWSILKVSMEQQY